jgi:hypothetical protein
MICMYKFTVLLLLEFDKRIRFQLYNHCLFARPASQIESNGYILTRIFNRAIDSFYDNYNRGKQWKDIRHRYVTADSDDE